MQRKTYKLGLYRETLTQLDREAIVKAAQGGTAETQYFGCTKDSCDYNCGLC